MTSLNKLVIDRIVPNKNKEQPDANRAHDRGKKKFLTQMGNPELKSAVRHHAFVYWKAEKLKTPNVELKTLIMSVKDKNNADLNNYFTFFRRDF